MNNTIAEIGPEHPLSYRQEVVAPLFAALRASDSCAIVGSSSMGKSRLLQFIQRPDVQAHGLGKQATRTDLVLVDHNRLAAVSEWGFYELLLTALTEMCGRLPRTASLRQQLNKLRYDAIVSEKALLARRNVELAVHMICQERKGALCLLLDEFDETYRSLPAPALANLRALRDANKYQLCFVLLMREHPARLRPPVECEGFYELFSRTVLGLGPYCPADAARVAEQVAARHGQPLTPQLARGLELSGGHPGLLLALLDALASQADAGVRDWTAWSLTQPAVVSECNKLWIGLADDERIALSHIARGLGADKDILSVLELKGLYHAERGTQLFSPAFTQYVLSQAAPVAARLWVDDQARVVWLDQRQVPGLTAREFELLLFLYRHAGHVCTHSQIVAHLHPDEAPDSIGTKDERVATLVKRLRKKIEPAPHQPRFILTVRDKGYKLAAE